MRTKIKATLTSHLIQRTIKWTIGKKMALVIIGASVLSLILGTPIALLKSFVFNLEIMESLGIRLMNY
ncbi:hypothetical protein [Paenibacillus camelliae]|uniref:hypothetical protein n=1 Tax=Paenibacillus camelliae TaxID=512410 RepID=UPI0020422B61|nr:hypothetical protein [Paenibacillus camelliae]MCM3634247.1 hypothetical protein [Paenibacillus camelliae]